MSEQIVDLIEAVMPGPRGMTGPQGGAGPAGRGRGAGGRGRGRVCGRPGVVHS